MPVGGLVHTHWRTSRLGGQITLLDSAGGQNDVGHGGGSDRSLSVGGLVDAHRRTSEKSGRVLGHGKAGDGGEGNEATHDGGGDSVMSVESWKGNLERVNE